jgi:hypothetical protein
VTVAVAVALAAAAPAVTPAAAATTTELSLQPASGTIDVGTTTTYEIVSSTTDDGVGSYNVTVGVDDPSVARIVDAENRIGGNARVRVADDNASVRIRTAEGNTVDRGSAVVLATVTVRGTGTGETSVALSSTSIRDETDGDRYTVSSVTGSSLIVNRPVTVGGQLLNPDRTAPVTNALVVFESADGEVTARASTDEEGRYAATIPSGRTYAVTAFDRTADGALAPRNGIVDVWKLYEITPEGDVDRGVTRLPAGNPVTVRVEDPGGRPVRNATLRVASLFGEVRDRTNLSTRTTRNGTLRVREGAPAGLELSGRTRIEVGLTTADRQFQSTTLTSTLTVTDEQSVRFVATPERVAPDVVGEGNHATDPDGDGRYEDLNGDGDATPGDAGVLFDAVFEGNDAVLDNPALFDFSGDGDVTAGDATVLFEEVF